MALTTGDFKYYYGDSTPATDTTGDTVGGAIDTGNEFAFHVTGLFPTGQSNLPGSASFTRYAKLFIRHEGNTGETLTNPLVYISNENISDQLTIAADPSFTGAHAAPTGTSSGRVDLPDQMNSTDFVDYNVGTPLDLSSISGSTVQLDSGDYIALWLKLSIPAGLSDGFTNTFNLVLRGEI